MDGDRAIEVYITAIEHYRGTVSGLLSIDAEGGPSSLRDLESNLLRAYRDFERRVGKDVIEEISQVYKKGADQWAATKQHVEQALTLDAEYRKKTVELLSATPAPIGGKVDQAEIMLKHLENSENVMFAYSVAQLGSAMSKIVFGDFMGELHLAIDLVSIPKSLVELKSKRRRRVGIQLLVFVGLLFTSLGFFPPLAIIAGVLGVLWFFVQWKYLGASDLKDLRNSGRLLREIEADAQRTIDGLGTLRSAASRVEQLQRYWPKDVQSVLERLRLGQQVQLEDVAQARRSAELIYEQIGNGEA